MSYFVQHNPKLLGKNEDWFSVKTGNVTAADTKAVRSFTKTINALCSYNLWGLFIRKREGSTIDWRTLLNAWRLFWSATDFEWKIFKREEKYYLSHLMIPSNGFSFILKVNAVESDLDNHQVNKTPRFTETDVSVPQGVMKIREAKLLKSQAKCQNK